jgi:hypothetical protein
VNIVENILAINLTLEQTGEIKCAGDATAGIRASITGGKEPYTLTWNNGISNTKTPSSLKAGTYRLSVVDAIGNTISKDQMIKEPTALSMHIEVQSPASANNSDGRAFARVAGGTAPYSIHWSNAESGARHRHYLQVTIRLQSLMHWVGLKVL